MERAQGTIEYLVILAVVVIVGLVVVSLMMSSAQPAQGISGTTSTIATQANPIALSEGIVDSDGNYYIKLTNNTGENIAVTSIQIGDKNPRTYDTPIAPSADQAFIINTEDICSEGQLIVEKIVVTYENQYGLEKRQTYPVPAKFECTEYEVTTTFIDESGETQGNGDEEPPAYSCTGTTPSNSTICTDDDQGLTENTAITLVDACGTPKCECTCNPGYERNGSVCEEIDLIPPAINLISPQDNDNNSNGYMNVSFSVEDTANDVRDCNLTIEGTMVETLNSPSEGTPISFSEYDFLEGEASTPTTITWSIQCADTKGNEQTTGNLTLNYSYECGYRLLDTRDGLTYRTVEIGSQCWFRDNLNYGTMILATTHQSNDSLVEKYCYDNDEANCDANGGLYEWHEAAAKPYSCMTSSCSVPSPNQGICPNGWHVPSLTDWHTVEDYLKDPGETCNGGRDREYDCHPAGDRMKRPGDCEGRTPCGTSGFDSELAGSVRMYQLAGTFSAAGTSASHHNAEQYNYDCAWNWIITRGSSMVYKYHWYGPYKQYGFSVRCMKD